MYIYNICITYYCIYIIYSLLKIDTTTGTVGALIGAEARSSEVASSFPGFSVPEGGKLRLKKLRKMKKETKTDINFFAAPRADHLVGQQGARGVAARSRRGEVVAEVPSTPHR